MRLSSIRLVAALVFLWPGMIVAAEEDDTLAQLSEALAAVATFDSGGDSGPLRDVERIVFQLPTDSKLRGPVEKKLLAALDAATTVDAKAFLCRQLRVIGTARCVPALEKLLTDPQLSHMARRALGRLEADEAADALHRALGKTSGVLQVGLINTLGERRYLPVQSDLARLLGSSDTAVAGAAAAALGRLGTTDAAKALRAARQKAAGEPAIEIDNALLACAEALLASGDTKTAAGIYEAFHEKATSQALQFAALRGLVRARGEAAVELLVAALRSEDTARRRYAVSLIAIVEGAKATKAFVDALGSLPPEEKVLMLRGLGARGDAAAAPAVVALAKDQDQAVRVAALDALGALGDVSVVAPLVASAASADGDERNAARASLKRLGGRQVDDRLMQLLADGPAATRAEAIDALASRGVASAVGSLLRAAEDEDQAVRSAAIRAIGTLAGKPDLGALVKLAANAKTEEDRAAVVEAAGKLFSRVGDKDACAAPVLAALKQAKADAQPALLRLLSKAGSQGALREVRAAIGSADPAMKEAAIRALADWPDQAAAEDLLKLMTAADSQAHKELALRGYLRLAAMSEDPGAMYLGALRNVERVGDKKAVLEGLGLASDSPEALDVAVGLLDDESLKANAGVAALRIAHRLRQKDEGRARAALKTVLAKVRHEDVRRRAQEVLNELDKYEDHILAWVGTGPFTEKGKSGSDVYAKVFEPETNPDAADWKPITKGIGSWAVNLEATYGGLDFCAAYLRTRVWSPVDQDAQLELGSDDAIKAWLGGKLVHDAWKQSGAEPRQVVVPVKLAKGWNVLMLKVVDHTGGWVAGCRIRKPDGTAREGLKIQPQPGTVK